MPRITESIGDIFEAPPNSVLIHACNCQGVWGSGVALEFKHRYPKAYEVYHTECNTPPSPFHQRSLLGTALLIPPQSEDLPSPSSAGHWIACLFTSIGYGGRKSSADVILEMTKKAMGDLAKKLKFTRGRGTEVGELWAVRLNSGKFAVKWDRTKRVLEQCGMDLKVVGPPEEEAGEDEGRKGRKGGKDAKKEKDEETPGNIMDVAQERAPAKGQATENRASVPKPAYEAEALPVLSKKRKKTKGEPQGPEVGSETSAAGTSKVENAETSSVTLQPKKHKKSKRETDEPEPSILADAPGRTEKKRRKWEVETEQEADVERRGKKKKKEKSKKDRNAD
ncbi:ADP-ribose 1''-phosphate phosphatase [Trapelia coarctata]|nr:ADP-ribose 1''-phosphate phosphatase [Trapelia coarctata]